MAAALFQVIDLLFVVFGEFSNSDDEQAVFNKTM